MTFTARLSWPNIARILSPNLSNFVNFVFNIKVTYDGYRELREYCSIATPRAQYVITATGVLQSKQNKKDISSVGLWKLFSSSLPP